MNNWNKKGIRANRYEEYEIKSKLTCDASRNCWRSLRNNQVKAKVIRGIKSRKEEMNNWNKSKAIRGIK
jgi:hypothetical protein